MKDLWSSRLLCRSAKITRVNQAWTLCCQPNWILTPWRKHCLSWEEVITNSYLRLSVETSVGSTVSKTPGNVHPRRKGLTEPLGPSRTGPSQGGRRRVPSSPLPRGSSPLPLLPIVCCWSFCNPARLTGDINWPAGYTRGSITNPTQYALCTDDVKITNFGDFVLVLPLKMTEPAVTLMRKRYQHNFIAPDRECSKPVLLKEMSSIHLLSIM